MTKINSFSQKIKKFSKTWAGTYILFILINWLLFFIFRIAFLLTFKAGLTAEAHKYLAQSFYTGAKFDLRLACIVSILFGVFMLLYSIFAFPKTVKKIFSFLYALILSGVIYVYVVDFAHYQYLRLRANASVLKYLEDLSISIQMMWETYPVIWISLGLIAFLYGVYRCVLFLINRVDRAHEKWLKKTGKAFGLILLTGACMYGQIALFPLRWSNAYFSSNTFISNLTLNPVLNMYDTYRFAGSEDYNAQKLKEHYDMLAAYLGVQNPDKEKLNFERTFAAQKTAGSGYNVVLIFMESFAWNKISLSNEELKPTPFAEELSKESVLFDHFFTPTCATARSVFTALTSIPDVSSFKTNSRNPFLVDQHMIANDFKGYEKYYFIGGSASWGNIRGIIKNNLDDLKLYEEQDYDTAITKTDVWGVSDLSLFQFSAKELAKENKPFFAVIQTAGFHRPYTIPKENAGFEKVDIPLETLNKYSFNSLDEYNSLRFSDHALREFFKVAKTEPYYKNTIFVIFGDHGLSNPHADNMPKGYQVYDLINHNVPLIVHAPNLLKPQRISTAASEVDIMPTVAGLIGAPYMTRGMGRDLFSDLYKKNTGAFLYGFTWYPPTVSFLRGDKLFYSRAAEKGLYKYAAKDYHKDISAEHPSEFKEMGAMADGLMEAAKYMIYNNKKEN